MEISKRKILITGGSGFIGTNAVSYFLEKNYDILSLDIKEPQNPLHNHVWKACDILDFSHYNESVQQFKPNLFLHLAARTDLDEKKDIKGYDSNITGVENTVKIINECESIERTIFASSRMVCRIDYSPKSFDDYCPPNLYGESKVIGEKIIKSSDIRSEWIIVRPTSIWGPWFDIPYKIFFTTIKNNLYFHPGSFTPLKSFGYVENSVFQLDNLFAANKNLVNKNYFYLCDYPPLVLNEWAELIRKEMLNQNLKVGRIRKIPFPVLKLLSITGDTLSALGWSRVPITSFRLNNIITDMVYDTQNLRAICGPLPHTLETSVSKTVAWMKKKETQSDFSK